MRIITYNILDGGGGRATLIEDVLRAARPDVVVLQEVIEPHVAERLAEALGMELFVAAGTSRRNLALLSRYPISAASSHHPFPPIRTAILAADVEYQPGQRLRIYGCHLVPHFAWPLELWRCWELAVLLRHVRQSAGPCLIAGDFNAIAPGDRVLREQLPPRLRWMIRLQGGHILHMAVGMTLRAGFRDCYRQLHPDADGFTVPAGRANARLDYLFANQNLAHHLKECLVIDTPPAHAASDHYPVLAQFEFPLPLAGEGNLPGATA